MDQRCRRHAGRRPPAGSAGWCLGILLALSLILSGGCAARNETGRKTEDLPLQAPSAATPPGSPGASGPVAPTVVEPSVVAYHDYRDPLIGLNRAVFTFNDAAYRHALIPASRRYLRHVPEPVRRGIGRFFANLMTPVYLVNHMLQLQAEPMVRSLHRFGINSTIGLLGFFDPAAERYGLEPAQARFEDTLINWGAGYGVYLVLPLFGPSDVRNSSSLIMDRLLNPIPYLLESPGSELLQGFDYFQEFAPEAEQYELIRREAEEPYIFVRNLYLQGIQRDVEY